MINLMQEIVDMIVDNLQDSPEDLRACSLTCRSWAHRSRKHLFKTISFKSREDICKWAVAFTPSTTTPRTYMADPNKLVTTLRMGTDRALETNSLTLFTSHLRKFTNVKHLALSNWHPSASLPSQSPKFHFGHLAPSLRSLTLIKAKSMRAAPLLQFICMFPHLDDLEIRGLSFDRETDRNSRSLKQENFARTVPSFSGHLSLSAYRRTNYCAGFLSALASIPASFSSMSLLWIHASRFQDWTTLLESSATTLKHLELSVSKEEEEEEEEEKENSVPLSLHKIQSLETLTINIDHSISRPCSVTWIAESLKTISSPTLTRIIFTCYDIDSGQDEDDWVPIDQELLRLCEASTLGLKIVFKILRPGCYTKRMVRRTVVALLPRACRAHKDLFSFEHYAEGVYKRCVDCGMRYEGKSCDCGYEEEEEANDEDEQLEEVAAAALPAPGQPLEILNGMTFEEVAGVTIEEARHAMLTLMNQCVDSIFSPQIWR